MCDIKATDINKSVINKSSGETNEERQENYKLHRRKR